MTAENHRGELAALQDLETRFVWALHVDADEPWYLEDDQAAEQRAFVKASLVCPVPGCASPLTSVHHASRRDHFRHLSKVPAHHPESLLHSQGCAAVEAWLRKRYPGSTVRREEYASETGERRADVMLTSAATGQRIAFEIQYSPTRSGEWERRHASYRRMGVLDVWLFGSTGRASGRTLSRAYRPTPTHTTGWPMASPCCSFIRTSERHRCGSRLDRRRSTISSLDGWDVNSSA